MGLNMGVYGLAWAAVIVSAIEVAILFVIMSQRIPGLFDKPFVNATFRMVSTTGLTALFTYALVAMLPLSAEDVFFSSFWKFSLIVGVTAIVYIIICRLFKIEEVNPVLEQIRKILFKRPEVTS